MKRTRLVSVSGGLVLALAAGPGSQAAESAGQYDGSWDGTQTFVLPGNNVITSDFAFEVVDDGITSVDLSVATVGSGCTPVLTDTTIDLSSDPAPIVDDAFSFSASSVEGGVTLTVDIDGAFDSASEASGAIVSSATSGACEISLTGSWEAGRPVTNFQPDALVKAAGSAYVGQNVYHPRGKGQKVSRTVRGGRTQVFFVVVSNDGARRDEIWVEGAGSSGPFSVRYLDMGFNVPRDVTSSVTAGNYFWNVPAQSGNWGLLKVVVSVDPDAGSGTTKTIRFVESSDGDREAVDAVVMKVIVS